MEFEFTEKNKFGQRHPIETAEKVADALRRLDEHLLQFGTTEDRAAFDLACQQNSSVVSSSHKLMFLRCELFNVDLAAKRLCNYWTARLVLFGEEKAFQELKLETAMKDDMIAIELGIVKVLPNPDEEGRTICFFDPSLQNRELYTRESLVRCLWYCFHVALERESAQQRGIILCVYPRNAKHSHFDRGLAKMFSDSMKRCLPIRIGSFQVCHPPTFFVIIFPILKLFLGAYLRNRICVNGGSDEKVLKKLNSCGIPSSSIPEELGGEVVVDNETWKAWLKERKQSE
uniref:CRAL-TRIO domain-containing protein n=1 Tax=Leptocylindrus danicus TaxID=163516 RepID=A0A7S2KWX8_9STRA|mmetsp:Transcript_28332/g.41679  ORF Transcript_28332/g.41679 Transcript_28332/m.41679 type:complete len:287 (+) Transcript_28332:114-974(+)|eukprot:CAMPEP_0116005602 /NCGR_PEP_ID=MMETSP0321-20121206/1257_1 /TAXON_ID=163516 /ORGANISM="Leptocylindrus danicus var. danicus, Strain B650" /LENGTH=286 /DNA_ID=CAMNT_0003474049 /DNA_START=80 /DNA_END=940 /DNA_ORIENTATION=+